MENLNLIIALLLLVVVVNTILSAILFSRGLISRELRQLQ